MAPKFAIDIHADAADLLTAPISISVLGNNTIIAGATGTIIRVYKMALVANSTNNLIFMDGGNSLSGPISFAANQGIILDFDTKPWFSTSMGNSFIINLSSATPVNGILYYTFEQLGPAEAIPLPPPAPPTTPANAYVSEDGATFYVAEDGATFYVQES